MLVLGDCLDVLPTLATGSVGMVFADLPYGCTDNAYDLCAKGRRVDAKPINKRTYPLAMERLWPELLRVGRRNCAFVFTATQPFSSYLVYSQPQHFRYELVWHKLGRPSGHLHARTQPLKVTESVLVFYRSTPVYNPQKTARAKPCIDQRSKITLSSNFAEPNRAAWAATRRVYTELYPTSLLAIPRVPGRTHHPNEKSVALLEWLVKTYSNPGDVILDPCAGSGTTAVAAIRTGRQYVCIEKDPTYHATAERRIAEVLTPASPEPARKPRRKRSLPEPPPA